MQKNVLMFANKKEMRRTNRLLKAGVATIAVGVTTLVIGGLRFYKTVWAIQSDNCKSNVIDNMFNDLITLSQKTES
jgi:uncharacterized membrane protein YidH (DUF202 family)